MDAAMTGEDPLTLTEQELRQAIELGLADAAAGRTVNGQQALRRFRALADQLQREAAVNGAAQRQG